MMIIKIKYVKHGFHLHFPWTFIDRNEQKVHILNRVKDIIKKREIFKDLGIEDSSSVIDDKIYTNPWLLYGSSKSKDMDPYLLTKIYDEDLNEITLAEALEDYEIYNYDESDLLI